MRCRAPPPHVPPEPIASTRPRADLDRLSSIRKLFRDSLIIVKPAIVHSRSRAREHLEAKSKGRHTGPGKRKGSSEARMPTKCALASRSLRFAVADHTHSTGSCG